MGDRKRNQRRKQHTEPAPTSDAATSLVGQLLRQGLREERQKWYGLLIFLPRFVLTLRFDRRVKAALARMAAAQQLGSAEKEAAGRQYAEEFTAILVEKKRVKPQ